LAPAAPALAPSASGSGAPTGATVEGWRLGSALPSPGHGERFLAVREADGRRGLFSWYAPDAEPDAAVYEAWRRLPSVHVPELLATGQWQERNFEVTEELPGGDLATLGVPPGMLRPIVEQLGSALGAFAACGLRHRNLRPAAVQLRCREPLALVITDFRAAVCSELDLDILAPATASRYMAPEVIAGGVAAASDWWSLGMLLLELLTQGACFEGVNEQTLLIHVVTNGVSLPPGLEPTVDALLRGLLARDRRERWQWPEVRSWLAGEPVAVPAGARAAPEPASGAGIELAGKTYRTGASFALAAAEPAHWSDAVNALVRGAVSSWAREADFDPVLQAQLREAARDLEVPEDLRLSMALKLLNPAMPLIIRGQIVSPGWLLQNPREGYELICGPVPDFLARQGAELWLRQMKVRAAAVRSRAQMLEINVDEEELRVYLLTASGSRLSSLWDERRRRFPDTDHPALAGLMDRKCGEEDLILLLAASIGQYRPLTDVVEAAQKEASRARVGAFSPVAARAWLQRPRREIYRSIDERISRFARCGVPRVDEWADGFRLDRRMSVPRALALLAVPAEVWKPLPRQDYISRLLELFSRRITTSALRGPLARMTIGPSSARIDLTELGTARVSATGILTQLLARAPKVHIDAAALTHGLVERRLRRLHSRSQLYRRDTGIDGLYLGFPFLLLRDPDSGATRIAPVLLWPVRIVPVTGSRGHVTLGFGREREPGQVILNPAFEGLMGAQQAARWQEVAEDLATRDATVSSCMDAFGTLAAARGSTLAPLPGKDVALSPERAELAPAAVLFHLAFMGQAIVKDLDALRGRPPDGTALEAALRLTGAARPAPVPVKEAQRYFTASSDPSQEEAVMEARSLPGLVVEGPPGTGKSQTIVNMVADAIGCGRSLLVICQKQAALEVVRKRLEREQLSERIVMLTDVSLDREPVVRAIREQVEALHRSPATGEAAHAARREALAARIETLESEIDRHQAALHRIDERTRLSYRMLLAELIALSAARPAPVSAPGLRPLLGALVPAQVAALTESCAPLAPFWLHGRIEDSALSCLATFSPDEGSLQVFRTAFNDLGEAESARSAVLRSTPGASRIKDAPAVRAWLRHNEPQLTALSRQEREDLARGLHLPAAALLAGLEEAAAKLPLLDAAILATPAASCLQGMEDAPFARAVSLAASATRPAGGLARLNPARGLARWRLTRLMSKLGLAGGEAAMSGFAAAVAVECAFRPLRRHIEAAAIALGAAAPEAHSVPQRLRLASSLQERLSGVQTLLALSQACPDVAAELSRAAGTDGDLVEQWLLRLGSALKRCAAREASLERLQALEPCFQPEWLAARRAAIEQDGSSEEALRALSAALPTLAAYQQFRVRAARLGETELAIFRVLRGREALLAKVPGDELAACVRNTLATEAHVAWKAQREAAAPEIFLDGPVLAAKVETLAKSDADMRLANRELLASSMDRSRVRPMREWEEITRLRGQRALRLREFIDRGIELGLLALRPVWLMTPDVASRVLQPRAGLFDTVIYDEASQMPIEYALPTLFRSKVVVISGDEKQMPPTAFFTTRLASDTHEEVEAGDGADDAAQEDEDARTEPWQGREIQDCPDLLHLGRAVLPVRTLQVHYRSRYRELIAFSNAAFYGNRLSVPVRHPDAQTARVKPVEVIRADGRYQDQSNLEEAQEVVEYLAKAWRKGSPPSVGVVTFNRVQADVIEEAIEARAQSDEGFASALMRERERTEDGADMGFFVKNVENVQGDERDVIVFSTTFGRNAKGSFRRAFGALGQAGGERRLNVAVSRAREKVVLVTSMPVAEISDMLSSGKAPSIPRDYLQAYLQYAHLVSAGKLEQARKLLGRVLSAPGPGAAHGTGEKDGFTEAVASFLRSEGWQPADARDGGAFGLDFAIPDPRTGLYAIGIECDAPCHPILERARAREVWRPGVLRSAVPHVHRVSSYAWMHAGDAERARLRAAVQSALVADARAS
jgi:hypothetical protein